MRNALTKDKAVMTIRSSPNGVRGRGRHWVQDDLLASRQVESLTAERGSAPFVFPIVQGTRRHGNKRSWQQIRAPSLYLYLNAGIVFYFLPLPIALIHKQTEGRLAPPTFAFIIREDSDESTGPSVHTSRTVAIGLPPLPQTISESGKANYSSMTSAVEGSAGNVCNLGISCDVLH